MEKISSHPVVIKMKSSSGEEGGKSAKVSPKEDQTELKQDIQDLFFQIDNVDQVNDERMRKF